MKLYVILMSLAQSVFGYNPVLLIHGILSEAKYLQDLETMIESEHPGTEVYLVSLYPELESFVPLQRQLKYWRAKIEPVMKNATEGVNLICHSQGNNCVCFLFQKMFQRLQQRLRSVDYQISC